MYIITKFKLVEILLISKGSDNRLKTTNRHEFENCSLRITGDYLIVTIDETDEHNVTLTSTNKIFNLNEVSAYKTHLQ
jgi:hypothetical protein